MKKERVKQALALCGLLSLLNANIVVAETATGSETRGQQIAFDRNAGNCLACHIIAGGELPGLIGPPLMQMKLRFPDRAILRAQIWDAASKNPDTVMPPYGRHRILTEAQVDLVVDFIHSL